MILCFYYKLESSDGLYRFSHFLELSFRRFFANMLIESLRTSSVEDGYAAKLLTILEENICIIMLCDNEMQSEPGGNLYRHHDRHILKISYFTLRK